MYEKLLEIRHSRVFPYSKVAELAQVQIITTPAPTRLDANAPPSQAPATAVRPEDLCAQRFAGLRRAILSGAVAIGLAAFCPVAGVLGAGASFRGRAISDVDGIPIADARISVVDNKALLLGVWKTGASGEFELPVKPGDYRIRVEKVGFFTETHSVSLKETNLDLGDMILTAKRSLSGSVNYADYTPAAGIPVQICAVRVGGRNLEPISGATARSDQKGAFRVDNLQPGRYVLVIQPNTATRSGRAGAAGALFVPGSLAPDVTNAFDLRYTVEFSGIAAVLTDMVGGDVSGRVSLPPSIENAAGPARVSLLTIGEFPLELMSQYAGPDGAFRLSGVPSGAYYLAAVAQDASLRPHMGLQRIEAGAGEPVTIAIQETQMLRGSIIVETDSKASIPAQGVLLRASLPEVPLVRTAATVNGDGQFELMLLLGSTFRVELENLPPNCYLSRASVADSKYGIDPLVVKADASPLRLVLRSDGGVVNGGLRSASPERGLVVLSPKGRRSPASVRVIGVDRRGRFGASGIPPGDYDLFVFERESDYPGAERLSEVERFPTPIAVKANGVLELNLAVGDRQE